MSIGGQLLPHYGNNDTVGVLRDIDLVLGLGYESKKLASIFKNVRERVVAILSRNPELGSTLRNEFFRAKDDIVEGEVLSAENKGKMKGMDHIHWEYERLMFLRQRFEKDPESTLRDLLRVLDESLRKFPLPQGAILSLTQEIRDVTEGDFGTRIQGIHTKLRHIGVVSFCEGCIAEGKCLNEILQYSVEQRQYYNESKKDSMEYWNFTNILNLARTRQKMLEFSESGKTVKSFVLSGGAGNAFTQLAIIQKFVEDGGSVRSISGTSMGAAVAVLVGCIGNDARKLRELMDDLIIANNEGEIPQKLRKNEFKMIAVFDRLRKKYGIGHGTKFSSLKIPVVVNAGRQYKGGEQEIVLGGDEDIIPSVLASMNVPFPHRNNNTGALGSTPIHGVDMIDYATNERGNPTHWAELLGEKQENLVVIDVGYSSENGGSPTVRRIFQRATIRDSLAKLRVKNAPGGIIDIPLSSTEGYTFPEGAVKRFFDIGTQSYSQLVTSQSPQ